MFRFCTILLLLVSTLKVFAGTKLPIKISWSKDLEKLEVSSKQYKNLLRFYGSSNIAEFGYLPIYTTQLKLNNESDLSFNINNAIFETANVNGSDMDINRLNGEISIQYTINYEKKQPVASIYFIPLRKNNFGAIEKLVQAELDVTILPKPLQRSAQRNINWPANSVLQNGNWYKISVAENGIHKIDYNLLNSLGLNPANINPKNIRIYGNGGGLLPEENKDLKYTDLQENAITVVGENDGRFDQGDYILFYAQGPNQWQLNETTNRYEHKLHYYSDLNYYFITVDLGLGKRVNTLPLVTNANQTVNTFDDYAFHEKDEYNFLASGREWYGDLFNFSVNNKTFNFNFPNINVASPVYLRAATIAKSTVSSSIFRYNINGQNIFQQNIGIANSNYTAPVAMLNLDTENSITFNSGESINITVSYSNPSSSAEGYINYLELNARRNLIMVANQLNFRDKVSVGIGNKSLFQLSNANNGIKIIDVTDPLNAGFLSYTLNGNTAEFTAATDSLKQFVAYYENGTFPAPTSAGNITNQNLHAIGQPDMLIITNDDLFSSASILANHHIQKNGLSTKVVKVSEIYNEFSNGTPDISAIRNFVRMIYDKAGNNIADFPQYLLLFGDASYDYKNRKPDNTNFVPTYESPSSLDPISSFNTDDYYGCLDENEGGSLTDNNDRLDVAIGRLPVKNNNEAQDVVAKIINYQSTNSLGAWRNELCFIADDEDNDLHLRDADAIATFVDTTYNKFNVDKIYLDSYVQVSTPSGSRYPDVNDDINRKVFTGALIMTYAGHGGTNGLTEERVLAPVDINSWENFDKLSLWITATCEFAKFDDPDIVSAGELVLLNPRGGGIALVTTLRLVFASANRTLNENFFKNVFEPYNNRYPTMGEVVSLAKNNILSTSDDTNLRKFCLLGDPSVRLNYPYNNVVTTNVSGVRSTAIEDTLRALSKVTITGEVRDLNGNKMNTFSGIVYPIIFDKRSELKTLANDPTVSSVKNFNQFKNVIYKGKASVVNGAFTFTFVVPKDISYSYGKGKISYYADNGTLIDAHGFDTSITIGGAADSFALDNQGPLVKVYMNDDKFAFGGITDNEPLLLVKLEDDNGINTIGTGIGHDLTGVLDEKTEDTYLLNEYYSAELDNFTKGEIRFPLSKLPEGRRNIRVKAWDVYNNSSEGYTEFIVATSAELALGRVLNYPNPFTTNTRFQFEHNKPGQPLFVQVKIFTVSGKLVKTIQKDIVSESYRVDNISWDGLDDFGDRIGRGVYVYKVDVRAEDGATAQQFEKLVILK